MISRNVLLAPLTTFHIGGPARFFIEARTEEDIREAIEYAREHNLPLYPLGAGSNILVPDAGVAGVVVKLAMRDIVFENNNETLLIAGAGALWEDVVDAAGARRLFGIENLAGIPGTTGGAAVQNIGAYGAELTDVFEYADVINSVTGVSSRVSHAEADFGYRTSFFKKNHENIITRVALRLTKRAVPNSTYPDLLRARERGALLTTPEEIARTVRGIRALKFPQGPLEGTAGSFFKNPVLSREVAESLTKRFPGVPAFPQKDGAVKISLAWLLDHTLSLKGFSRGNARLYEKHPLVIVTRAETLSAEVDALAREIEERVCTATGIKIEREVETFGVPNNFSGNSS